MDQLSAQHRSNCPLIRPLEKMNRKQRRGERKNSQNPPPGSSAGLELLFAEALRHHQTGQLGRAEQLYRNVLAANPRHADSLHLLGVIASQLGRHDVAVGMMSKAIGINAKIAPYHSNLGLALMNLGRLEEAVACWRNSLRLAPNAPEILNNLGNALQDLDRLDDAVAAYGKAVGLRPDYAEAHTNLGNALQKAGRLDEAIASHDKALSLKPQYAVAHSNLGNALQETGRLDEAVACHGKALQLAPNYAQAHNNLAIALQKLGRLDDAVASYGKSIELKPDYAAAYVNLGNVLQKLGRQDEAAASYRKAIDLKPGAAAYGNLGNALQELGLLDEAVASYCKGIELKPDYTEGLNNLGNALQKLGRLDEAVAAYRKAVTCDPRDAIGYNNLGIALQELGNLDEATACHTKAIALEPDYAEAHMSYSFALLKQGNLPLGWEEYAWRWQVNDKGEQRRTRGIPKPLWSGNKSDGGTILIWPEQGLGDCIQFSRYIATVSQLGWNVIVETPNSLKRLFETIPDITILSNGAPHPDFDVHCPLLDLPRLLGTTVQTIPSVTPYLHALPRLVADWRERLSGHSGLKVGVTWRGDPNHRRDQKRSMKPAWFSQFLDLPGITVVSLQKDARAEELTELGIRGSFVDAGPALADYADTAAVVANLDLVISVDTSVCHLAGAIGIPTWTLLDFAAEWRWLEHREDTPWYGSMRLFRQRHMGDWQPVVEKVRAELCLLE